MRISDDGIGAENAKHLIKGIGLANTKARLLNLYKNDQSLEIESDENKGFSVKLKIPFKTEKRKIFGNTHLNNL